MTVRVRYRDGKYGYVNSARLDELISLNRVKQFYRSSEDRWVNVERDPMRGKVKFYLRHEHRWVNLDVEGQKAWEFRTYAGKERRHCLYAL
jgi:hypothetical protein